MEAPQPETPLALEPGPRPLLSTMPGLPSPEPTTTAQLFAPAAPAKPWLLLHTSWKDGERHLVIGRDRFTTQEECHAGIVKLVEPRLKLVEHPANKVFKPEVTRQPGHYTWSMVGFGQTRTYEEATCEERP
jgi:hypothetical protein